MSARAGGWRVRVASLVGISVVAAVGIWVALEEPRTPGEPNSQEPSAAKEPSFQEPDFANESTTPQEPSATEKPYFYEPDFGLEGPKTVDIRVLVIATAGPDADAGLDLIDDVLETVGVRYDVLDSSIDVLDASRLAKGDRGFYNGIILTEAGLFLSAGQSGFTEAEWRILQDYEREFSVRESVMSGSPNTGSSALLDYGMSEGGRSGGYSGAWVGPAGSEFFAYVNTSNNLEITDFAFVGVARDDDGPSVTPLLVNAANTEQILVSYLRYDDGREVMLSTITNASFLLHSQVLAYEFVKFATRGLHLGARRVYLNAHVDDLFLSSFIWDVERNANSEEAFYRTTPEDIDTTVSAQAALRRAHPTLGEFRVEFAFNAFGSGKVPKNDFPLVADTTVAKEQPDRNYGEESVLQAGTRTSGERQILARFDMSSVGDVPVAVAGLRLPGAADLDPTTGSVCRVTQAWSEAEATWSGPTTGTAWTGGAGPTFDRNSCLAFSIGDGVDVVGFGQFIRAWQTVQPNHGVVLRIDGSYTVAARETGLGLAVGLGVQLPLEDPLTEKVVEAGDSLLFINHTFTHRNLDTSTGTTEVEAYWEIDQNRIWWDELGLPGLAGNRQTLVTGEHSGLADNNGTPEDLSDDTDFPEGANPALLDAAEAAGVRYIASDKSRSGQDQEVFIDDRDILLLPRYPTGVFSNVRTPAEMVDEYNWIFTESYLARGLDPCEVPSARCTLSTYDEVLAAEARIGLEHMLAYRQWPHYFHTANLVDYDSTGSTLLFDWLDEVLTMYETVFVLPVQSPPFSEAGERAEARLARNAATIYAVLDIESGQVALAADSAVSIEVTGVIGGTPYGSQLIADVALLGGQPRFLQSATARTTPSRTGERWVPNPGSTWQWQLSGTIDTDVDVDIYDIDLFDTSADVITELKEAGRRVICYFSAGSFEDWRPDADLFPADVIGASNGWPGERWLDIRAIPRLAPILEARLDLAVQKRCDAVEPDNIDAYQNESGFDIGAEDQVAFARWLAGAAHDRGLSIGLKNASTLAAELEGTFDWALNESCVKFNECGLLRAFTEAGKAVFHVEYEGDLAWCAETIELGFSSLEKDLLVGPEFRPCTRDTG